MASHVARGPLGTLPSLPSRIEPPIDLSKLYSEIDESNPPVAPAGEGSPAWIRWAKWIVILGVLLWLAGIASSLVIQHSSLKTRLTAHLSAAFGRPVEVGRYDLSFLGGPALEAESVTVGEDPRFGNEYFLRAESITVRLRWQSLLRGHLHLGTLSLSNPSLNLVRNPEGDWNLAEWLPRPAMAANAAVAPAALLPSLRALRFSRIEIDGGRIDFKRGDEKLPFSLVGVNGTVETESPGRWRLDLSAAPFRGAVIVQQAGTLHLTGYVGGTSSRLRPAILQLAWTNASIPDVLRLLRNNDYGVRGFVSLALEAHTEGYAWLLDGSAQLRQVHRWDLTARPDNPSLNLTARAEINAEDSLLDFTTLSIDAPHSHAELSGIIDWSGQGESSGIAVSPNELQLNSSGMDLDDLLAWVRAFRPDVAGDIALHGFVKMQMLLRGWPPWPAEGTFAVEGAELTGARLRVPVRMSAVSAHYTRNGFNLTPLTLSFGYSDGSLHIEFSSKAKIRGPAASNLHISGSIAHVRDLISTAGAFGWNLSRGWDLEGPLHGDLRWQGTKFPWPAEPTGSLEWGGESGTASLRTPFLNQSVEQIRARADWGAEGRHIALASAQAFGAHWSGTIDRSNAAPEWRFALSADHTSSADLDRWLNPRWRESFLDRLLPFLNPHSSANAVPESLRASGRIGIDQFTLAPLSLRRLQGDLKIEGRRIELQNVRGEMYGGEAGGWFVADLESIPSYHANLNLTHADLESLSAVFAGLADRFAGSLSGDLSLTARGGSRSDLVASLTCQGAARVNAAEIRGLNLFESLHAAAMRSGISNFREASAAFACGRGKISFQNLMLLGPGGEIDASGTADYTRNLDLRLTLFPPLHSSEISSSDGGTEEVFRLGGLLSAPQISRVAHASPRR